MHTTVLAVPPSWPYFRCCGSSGLRLRRRAVRRTRPCAARSPGCCRQERILMSRRQIQLLLCHLSARPSLSPLPLLPANVFASSAITYSSNARNSASFLWAFTRCGSSGGATIVDIRSGERRARSASCGSYRASRTGLCPNQIADIVSHAAAALEERDSLTN